MGMIGYLARVSPKQIEVLQSDPSLLLGATHIAAGVEAGDSVDDILAFLEQQTGADKPREFSRSYEALRNSAIAAAKLNLAPPLSLETEWHVLHFLLTGGAAKCALPSGALLGGDPIGEDLGYGPARLLMPLDVADFADFLDAQDPRELLTRFDMRKMRSAHVYNAPDDDDAERVALWVSVFVPKLRRYLAQARAEGAGLLLWTS